MESTLHRYGLITNYTMTKQPTAESTTPKGIRVILDDTRKLIPTVNVTPVSEGLVTIHNLESYRINTTSIYLIPKVECLVEKILTNRRKIKCIPTL